MNNDTVLAEILSAGGEVLRVVETTRERAESKGWRVVGRHGGSGSESRLNEIYASLQGHENAAAAHAKVARVLAALEHPAEYCQKTAFIAYINEPERAQ